MTETRRLRLFVADEFVGLRVGRFYVTLRGPSNRPLFSERNRIKCRVLPLRNGWRVVVRTDAHESTAAFDSLVEALEQTDLCDHGCGREATIQHADLRFLCALCYSTEASGALSVGDCPTCGAEVAA